MTKQESVNGETWEAKAGNFDDYLQVTTYANCEGATILKIYTNFELI